MTPLAKKVFELFGKPEMPAEREGKPNQEAERSFPAWPCRHCGKPANIETLEPSADGQRMLTFWHCPPCQTWGVTPDSIRQPPVWVSRKEQ